MTRGLAPTETADGRITVRLLDDATENRDVACGSYTDAIRTVRDNVDAVAAAKIVDRDGDVVFTSDTMNIDVWEKNWHRQKRRLSVSVEAYDCPHDSVACFADDLCVHCKMDAVRDQY